MECRDNWIAGSELEKNQGKYKKVKQAKYQNPTDDQQWSEWQHLNSVTVFQNVIKHNSQFDLLPDTRTTEELLTEQLLLISHNHLVTLGKCDPHLAWRLRRATLLHVSILCKAGEEMEMIYNPLWLIYGWHLLMVWNILCISSPESTL